LRKIFPRQYCAAVVVYVWLKCGILSIDEPDVEAGVAYGIVYATHPNVLVPPRWA
jgi:hypothetical protein